MDLNNYQSDALRTAIYPKGTISIYYCTLGLVGEAGEIANKVKKIIRDDNQHVSRDKRLELLDEMGDALWYLANLAYRLGFDFNEIAEHNIQKLESRRVRTTLQGFGDNR